MSLWPEILKAAQACRDALKTTFPGVALGSSLATRDRKLQRTETKLSLPVSNTRMCRRRHPAFYLLFSIIFTGFLPHSARQRLSTSHNVPLQAAGKGHTSFHDRRSRRCIWELHGPAEGKQGHAVDFLGGHLPSCTSAAVSAVKDQKQVLGATTCLQSKWARTNDPGDRRAHMTTMRSLR